MKLLSVDGLTFALSTNTFIFVIDFFSLRYVYKTINFQVQLFLEKTCHFLAFALEVQTNRL